MVKSGLGLEDVPDDEEWLPNLQKVSLMSNRIRVVPPSISPNCPQLATLLLSDCFFYKISKRFFQRMQGLKVIDLRRTGITEVPKSVMNLKKLNALVLTLCFKLSRIPSLAKLTSLRKLDLRGCIKIKEVPDGLGMLVNLTYLCLRMTGIKRIPDGVVCKLKKLQHLEADYIAVKGEEVGKLRKLELLHCRFENVNELNEYTRHATTIESYSLVIGAHTDFKYWRLGYACGDKLIYMGEGEYKIGETCHLPRDVTALWIQGYGGTWNISSFMGLEELKALYIEGCDEVSTLSGNEGQPEEPEGQLEERTSPPPGDHCPNLRLLATSTPFLPLLTMICVGRCHKMKRVLTLEVFMLLPNLQAISVDDCKEMKEVIGGQEESLTSSTSPLPPDAFSQLQSIQIVNCPEMENVAGPELLPLLHNLERIHVSQASNKEEIIAVPSLSPSPPPIPAATSTLFLPLHTEIYVERFHKMKRVLTLEVFMLLPNLQTISVYDCKEMKEVIGGQEESLTSSTSPLPPDTFSQLQSIQIVNCPEMKNVAGPQLLPLLHNLKRIKVGGASNMEEIIAVPSLSPSPPPIPAATSTPFLPLLTSIDKDSYIGNGVIAGSSLNEGGTEPPNCAGGANDTRRWTYSNGTMDSRASSDCLLKANLGPLPWGIVGRRFGGYPRARIHGSNVMDLAPQSPARMLALKGGEFATFSESHIGCARERSKIYMPNDLTRS
ncbi:hypothetical protein CRG98_042948 [Punica granatum]|uniref:Disease resistance protein At4g27190-like leucine-rich repeats domain-containing protein n=1 Tax=Punica granatum TaxID=22663 RepID=A0A2I0HY91_PUNGR|nr:hypothetical protein CRG98_042948 [Punica granatum]